MADRFAAAFATSGTGADVLPLNLASSEYTASLGQTSTADAALNATGSGCLPARQRCGSRHSFVRRVHKLHAAGGHARARRHHSPQNQLPGNDRERRRHAEKA